MHPKLKTTLEAFYKAVVQDVMIGFYFRGTNIPQLVEREAKHTQALFDEKFSDADRIKLQTKHSSFRIPKGHFNRRQVILKQTLQNEGWDSELAAKWLAHNESLRDVITDPKSKSCPK